MAACRLAAKGKSMADSGYDAEVKSIQAFLSMQHPASQPAINPATLEINVEEYVAPRFLRKMKSKVLQIKRGECLFGTKMRNCVFRTTAAVVRLSCLIVR